MLEVLKFRQLRGSALSGFINLSASDHGMDLRFTKP